MRQLSEKNLHQIKYETSTKVAKCYWRTQGVLRTRSIFMILSMVLPNLLTRWRYQNETITVNKV